MKVGICSALILLGLAQINWAQTTTARTQLTQRQQSLSRPQAILYSEQDQNGSDPTFSDSAYASRSSSGASSFPTRYRPLKPRKPAQRRLVRSTRGKWFRPLHSMRRKSSSWFISYHQRFKSGSVGRLFELLQGLTARSRLF